MDFQIKLYNIPFKILNDLIFFLQNTIKHISIKLKNFVDILYFFKINEYKCIEFFLIVLVKQEFE